MDNFSAARHPEHDRACSLATQAMETLLEKQKHQVQCPQCGSDPAWCKTTTQFDREFQSLFQTWLRNRPSGGVITHGGRKD
jgi:hypothetical protein